MFERFGQWLTRLRIPHPRCLVIRQCHEPLAIRTETELGRNRNKRSKEFERLERLGQWLAHPRIPHPRCAVKRRCHQPLAIRTELGGRDQSSVFERLSQWLARPRIPHPRRFVR